MKRANPGPDDSFLDIGCGPGAAVEHAAASGARVAGVDPSPSMVRRAARRVPDADVRVASAEHLPFPDHHFTVVVNVASFHHWADRDAGLREILRVLTAGGRLHIMEGVIKEGKDGHGLHCHRRGVITGQVPRARVRRYRRRHREDGLETSLLPGDCRRPAVRKPVSS